MLKPDWPHWVFGKMHGPTTDHSDLTCMGWAIHRRKMDDSFMPNLQKVLHTYLLQNQIYYLSVEIKIDYFGSFFGKDNV